MKTYRLEVAKATKTRRYSVAVYVTHDGVESAVAAADGYLGINCGHGPLMFGFVPKTPHVDEADPTYTHRTYTIRDPQDAYRRLCWLLSGAANEQYLRGPFRDALAQMLGVDRSQLQWEVGGAAVDAFLASLPATA